MTVDIGERSVSLVEAHLRETIRTSIEEPGLGRLGRVVRGFFGVNLLARVDELVTLRPWIDNLENIEQSELYRYPELFSPPFLVRVNLRQGKAPSIRVSVYGKDIDQPLIRAGLLFLREKDPISWCETLSDEGDSLVLKPHSRVPAQVSFMERSVRLVQEMRILNASGYR